MNRLAYSHTLLKVALKTSKYLLNVFVISLFAADMAIAAPTSQALGQASATNTASGNQQQSDKEKPKAKKPEKNGIKTDIEPSTAGKDAPAEDGKAIDWGGWNLKSSAKFGVGIQGDIEAQINLLDQSNLLDDATGVATRKKAENLAQDKQTKVPDLKKMMAELEAMEAKVKKEIDDDSEF